MGMMHWAGCQRAKRMEMWQRMRIILEISVYKNKGIFMKTYVIIQEGNLYKPLLGKNQRGYTEEEIEKMKKEDKLPDNTRLLCLEEEIEKYHLKNSNGNKWELKESVDSFYIWWHAYIDNNLNGFTIPISVKDNHEYRQELENILNRYIKYLNRPSFVYEEGLLDYIIKESELIIKALDCLICDNQDTADTILSEILDLFRDDPFLISDLDKSYSFRAIAPFQDLHSDGYDITYKKMMNTELTFFRARTKKKTDKTTNIHNIEDILHLPYNLKSKARSMRFSIQGLPGLYLSTSTYACSQECNWNKEDEELYASVFIPNEKGKTLKILNLTISEALINGIYHGYGDYNNARRRKLQISMLKVFPLVIATSFSVLTEENIKYQYLLSQALMRVASKNGIDGIAYFSMKGKSEFEFPQGVNLAIPATDISDSNLYSEKCWGFDISKPILYSAQKGSKSKSYINEIYPKYDDNGMKSFMSTLDVDGIVQFYGETKYGKFDDFLTTYLKYPPSKKNKYPIANRL